MATASYSSSSATGASEAVAAVATSSRNDNNTRRDDDASPAPRRRRSPSSTIMATASSSSSSSTEAPPAAVLVAVTTSSRNDNDTRHGDDDPPPPPRRRRSPSSTIMETAPSSSSFATMGAAVLDAAVTSSRNDNSALHDDAQPPPPPPPPRRRTTHDNQQAATVRGLRLRHDEVHDVLGNSGLLDRIADYADVEDVMALKATGDVLDQMITRVLHHWTCSEAGCDRCIFQQQGQAGMPSRCCDPKCRKKRCAEHAVRCVLCNDAGCVDENPGWCDGMLKQCDECESGRYCASCQRIGFCRLCSRWMCAYCAWTYTCSACFGTYCLDCTQLTECHGCMKCWCQQPQCRTAADLVECTECFQSYSRGRCAPEGFEAGLLSCGNSPQCDETRCQSCRLENPNCRETLSLESTGFCSTCSAAGAGVAQQLRDDNVNE